MVKVKPGAKVITIEHAQNALAIEWIVGLFSTAFEQACALKEVQRLEIDSFVQTKNSAIVQTIRPAEEALSIEGIVFP